MQGDADRARKHGMDEYISADPCAFNHHQLFRILQNLTLTYRLNEPVVSLGEYSLSSRVDSLIDSVYLNQVTWQY